MKYAINTLNFGPTGDARVLADLARDAFPSPIDALRERIKQGPPRL